VLEMPWRELSEPHDPGLADVGKRLGFVEAALIVPQTLPSTTIGAPTDERIPRLRRSVATGPGTPS